MSPKAIPDKATLPDFPSCPFFLALSIRMFRIFRFVSRAFAVFLLFCSMPEVDPHVLQILWIEYEESWDDWLCHAWVWVQPSFSPSLVPQGKQIYQCGRACADIHDTQGFRKALYKRNWLLV